MKSRHIQHLLRESETEQETVGNLPELTTFESWAKTRKKEVNFRLKHYHFNK